MLLDAVFRCFLTGYVWGATCAILATGFYLIYVYGGIAYTVPHPPLNSANRTNNLHKNVYYSVR